MQRVKGKTVEITPIQYTHFHTHVLPENFLFCLRYRKRLFECLVPVGFDKNYSTLTIGISVNPDSRYICIGSNNPGLATIELLAMLSKILLIILKGRNWKLYLFSRDLSDSCISDLLQYRWVAQWAKPLQPWSDLALAELSASGYLHMAFCISFF